MHRLPRAARVAALLSALASGLAAGTVALVNRSAVTWTLTGDPAAISASSGVLAGSWSLAPGKTWQPTLDKPAIDRLVMTSADGSRRCRLLVTTGFGLDRHTYSFLEATGPKVQEYLARGVDNSELVIIAPQAAGAGEAGAAAESKAAAGPDDLEDPPARPEWIFTQALESAAGDAGAEAEGRTGPGEEHKAERKDDGQAETAPAASGDATTGARDRAALFVKVLAERVHRLGASLRAWQDAAGKAAQVPAGDPAKAKAADTAIRYRRLTCLGDRGDVANWLKVAQDAVSAYEAKVAELPEGQAADLHGARLKGLRGQLEAQGALFSDREAQVESFK